MLADMEPPLATHPDMEAYMQFDLETGRASWDAWMPGENPDAERVRRGLVWLCPVPGHVPFSGLNHAVGAHFREIADRVFAGGSLTTDDDGQTHGVLNDDARKALAELELALRKNGRLRRHDWAYCTPEEWQELHPTDPNYLATLSDEAVQTFARHTISYAQQYKLALHPPDVTAHLMRMRRDARQARGLPPQPTTEELQQAARENDHQHPNTPFRVLLPDTFHSPPLPIDMPLATRRQDDAYLILDLAHRRAYIALVHHSITLHEALPADDVHDFQERAFRLPNLMTYRQFLDRIDAGWAQLLRDIYEVCEKSPFRAGQGWGTYWHIATPASRKLEDQLRKQIESITPPHRYYTPAQDWLQDHPPNRHWPNVHAATYAILREALHDGYALHPPDLTKALRPYKRTPPTPSRRAPRTPAA